MRQHRTANVNSGLPQQICMSLLCVPSCNYTLYRCWSKYQIFTFCAFMSWGPVEGQQTKKSIEKSLLRKVFCSSSSPSTCRSCRGTLTLYTLRFTVVHVLQPASKSLQSCSCLSILLTRKHAFPTCVPLFTKIRDDGKAAGKSFHSADCMSAHIFSILL